MTFGMRRLVNNRSLTDSESGFFMMSWLKSIDDVH